jgi:type IV secretory pathway TrbD component
MGHRRLDAAMGPRAIAAWQWADYARYHQSLRNLLVHIVAVPLFLIGNLAAVLGLLFLAWGVAIAGVVLSAIAFAVQGLGHKTEPVPSVPFSGPANVVGRILVEQWVTFPRFVLSGGWSRNVHAAYVGPPGNPA